MQTKLDKSRDSQSWWNKVGEAALPGLEALSSAGEQSQLLAAVVGWREAKWHPCPENGTEEGWADAINGHGSELLIARAWAW